MNTTPTTRLAAAVLALAGIAGLAACGDDADAALATEACDAAVELGSAMSAMPEDPAELGGFVESTLVPLGDTLVATMTGDGADAAKVLGATFASVAETGDPTPLFEDPATAEAQSTIGAAVHADCELEAVDISAVEYAYEGAPDELAAGRVSFALTNDGVEDHEMVLFRRADGVTDSFETLSQLPEDELFSKLTFVGVAFGGPDSTTYTALDLEAGTYFLVCFIPQGGGEEGPPHFMGGMQHTLVVT